MRLAPLSDFGKAVRDILAERRMTRKQLADASGLSLASLHRYESGFREVPREAMMSIASALGVELSRLECTGAHSAPAPRQLAIELVEAVAVQDRARIDSLALQLAAHVVRTGG